MLAVRTTSCPPRRIGRLAGRGRDLDRVIGVPSAITIANSSPPIRQRVAVRMSRRSAGRPAAAGPRRVAEGVVDVLEVVEVDEEHRGDRPAPSARSSEWPTGRMNSARFGRPVSGSWNAWWLSCACEVRRSVTSWR